MSTDIACESIWKLFHDTEMIYTELEQISHFLSHLFLGHICSSREVKDFIFVLYSNYNSVYTHKE